MKDRLKKLSIALPAVLLGGALSAGAFVHAAAPSPSVSPTPVTSVSAAASAPTQTTETATETSNTDAEQADAPSDQKDVGAQGVDVGHVDSGSTEVVDSGKTETGQD